MSTHPLRPLHVALYQKLTTHAPLMALIQGVYDYVPHEAAFPCLVMEDSKAERWGLLGEDAHHCELKLLVYSRQGGRKELMDITAMIHALLNHSALVVAGFDVALCEVLVVDTEYAVDGLTAMADLTLRCQMTEAV